MVSRHKAHVSDWDTDEGSHAPTAPKGCGVPRCVFPYWENSDNQGWILVAFGRSECAHDGLLHVPRFVFWISDARTGPSIAKGVQNCPEHGVLKESRAVGDVVGH